MPMHHSQPQATIVRTEPDATPVPADEGRDGVVVNGRRGLRRVAVVAGVAIVVVLVVFLLRYDVQRVDSTSMAPTMGAGDLLVVDPRAYDQHPPQRGDVVVFSDPGGWGDPHPLREQTTGELFVKRVVGVGGDWVYCCDAEGRLEVNGEPVDEDYLPADLPGQGLPSNAHIPDGHLWVLGDNRVSSLDSRHLLDSSSLGYVAEEDVTGRVVVTIPFPGFGSP